MRVKRFCNSTIWGSRILKSIVCDKAIRSEPTSPLLIDVANDRALSALS